MDLTGKVAVVTGGGKGIGAAICLKLAKYGANVVPLDIDEPAARSVASQAEAMGRKALAIKTDVTDKSQVDAMVKQVVGSLGSLDILVNNAGWDKLAPFVETTPDFWDKLIAINLKGVLNCCQAALGPMMERKSGKIVNIGSDAGRAGSSFEAVYSACKGGVIAFTKTLAREVARYNINVNCVCPGLTDTPLLDQIKADPRGAKITEAVQAATPFRRLAKPEEVAGAVLFFASPESDFVTGQTLSVSGGLTMN